MSTKGVPGDFLISSASSPPFRHISPFGTPLRCTLETFLRINGISSSRRITARDTTKSYFSWHSPISPCWNETLASPIDSATACATFIFLPIRSTRWNLQSGNIMASGIPGKPPPVPMSRTEVPPTGLRNFAIAREWSIWLV